MKKEAKIKADDYNDIQEGRYLPIRIHKSITVAKPVNEVYNFWRDFTNLPRFMKHLKSVSLHGERHSHWVIEGPAGKTIEWDAEITSDRENEIIGWRSMQDAQVDNAGSVEFKPVQEGTEVTLHLAYTPPAGHIGKLLATLFGKNPESMIEEELKRFKYVMETGASYLKERAA